MFNIRRLAILCFTLLLSFGSLSVWAIWRYAELPANSVDLMFGVGVNEFIYVPEEMPDEEVSVVQRLSDILNKKYQADEVKDSLDYLINETIQVYWDNDPTEDPFVGSMDKTYAQQIATLFEDVLMDTSVAFILKNQDLNGDGYNEIAMYSTSDKLDNTSSSYDGVVCVYVTVFTPVIESGKITGYHMVCESLRGYCQEIYYSPQNRVPSFSTDTWKNSVGYDKRSGWNTVETELPTAAQLDYNSYNKTYKDGNRTYTTKPVGDTLSTVLADKL